MLPSRRPLLLAACVLAAMAAHAQAATIITFEGQSNTIYNAPITRSGFDIGNPVGQEQHFHEIDSTTFSGFVPNNGTGVLYNDRNTDIFVVSSVAATFSLTSVDVATDLNGGSGGATTLAITGFLNGSQTGQVLVNLDQSGLYSLVLGGSLGTIDRLVFDGTGNNGGFTLDNLTLDGAIVANGVPEPSTVASLGLAGLIGLAARFRRRLLMLG